jgi:hypothetical protein
MNILTLVELRIIPGRPGAAELVVRPCPEQATSATLRRWPAFDHELDQFVSSYD